MAEPERPDIGDAGCGARPLVSVVIVTWNSREDIPACLAGVSSQDYPRFEFIVVDNNSADGTPDRIRDGYPDVTLIESNANLGYAGGNNRGLREARGEYVLLLNPDCFLDANFIHHLVECLEAHPEAGSASGRLLRPGGETVDSTGIVPNLHRLSPRDRDEGRPAGMAREGGAIFGPSGAAAFYRRAALDDAALDGAILDEDFFAYYEDVDLAWRLQLCGWTSLYVSEAVAEHRRTGPSRPGNEVFWTAFINRYFMVLKNAAPREAWGIFLRALPREVARLVRCALTRRGAVRAFGRFSRLLPGILGKRKTIRGNVRAAGFRANRFGE